MRMDLTEKTMLKNTTMPTSASGADTQVDRFIEQGLPPKAQWPRFLQASSGLQEPANFTCAALDAQIAAGRGDADALVCCTGDSVEALSYRELGARVAQMAHLLVREYGLVRGARVLLRGPNSLMMAIAWLAVVRAGAVVLTTMPLLRARELGQMVEKGGVALALCDRRYRADLETCRTALHARGLSQLLDQVVYFDSTPDDDARQRMAGYPAHFDAAPVELDTPAILAFTSGTTGTPKGTVHFHRDLHAICNTFPLHVLGLGPGDRCCASAPLGFTFGLGAMLCFPLYWGATGILVEQPGAAALLEGVERCGATVLFTVPTMYRQLLALRPGHKMAGLRLAVSAGEALTATTAKAWHDATGLTLIDGLGCTELLHIFISSPPARQRSGAVGQALPGYQIAVLDAGLRPLPAGQPGMLAVRGVTGCRYLSDERQCSYVRDGWNLTGDVGRLDEDGYFYYMGRGDDMIVSAGNNIAPVEVEDALLGHPAVAEAAVVGMPDAERGQVVQAYVVLKEGTPGGAALATALKEHVKQTLAPYKYPRSIHFCERLPRNDTGKLQRYLLRTGVPA
jgi:2-aminobenzoate-CoA ligase